MEFSFGSHICSILQVVALVVCFRGNVSGEIVQGCVGSQLNLRCPEMKVIQITTVVLGDTNCQGAKCCIKDNDCTYNPNENHRKDVHSRCDNKQSCTVDVLKEKIPCGWFNSDFERITYNCSDGGQNVTRNSTDNSEDTYAPATVGIVIACVVLIAIVASVSVVIVRRRKRQQVKPSKDIATSEALGTSLNEYVGSSYPICSNENSKEVEKSVNSGAKNFETPTNDYCELEGVARGRIQCDSEYEQLDHGRNYEPLVVYEQLQ